MIDFAEGEFQGPIQKVSLTQETIDRWTAEAEANTQIQVEYYLADMDEQFSFSRKLDEAGFASTVDFNRKYVVKSNCPAEVGRALIFGIVNRKKQRENMASLNSRHKSILG